MADHGHNDHEHSDAQDDHGQDDDAHDDHGHGGSGKYISVFIALCILTAISFVVANSPIMNTPAVGMALMMAVSCAKALLVIAFFMHLIWEASWKWVLTIPASIMSVFLVLMLVPDVGERTKVYEEERWLHASEPVVEEVIEEDGNQVDGNHVDGEHKAGDHKEGDQPKEH
ncbi:MAG: cytochrome c oxidase subunit 4 [Pirellulaceae bacterium]|jgi:cytochrome c oxidase subunit 4